MSWLEALTKEMLAKMPARPFAPSLIFGFEQVQRAIEVIECASKAEQDGARAAASEAVREATRDPSRSFIDKPLFAPMGQAAWYAEMTLPLILRRSLFIAICSHVEHVLRRWCHLLHEEWSLTRNLQTFPKAPPRESDLHHCMRYLRDEAALALTGFETWPEWMRLDAYRVVRNRLTHDGGIVEHDGEAERLSALPHIEVDESGLLMGEPTIVLLPGACEAAAENAKTFFDRVTAVCQSDARVRRDAPGTPT